jgi:hypothetical protein
MAPKGSINVELAEEFVDCTVRIQTSRGRVQGTLHSVNRQDQGLVFVIGTTGTSQFQSIEEGSIDTLEGESVDGFVQLYPLVEDSDEAAETEEDEPEDTDPANTEAGDLTTERLPLTPEATTAEVAEPTGGEPDGEGAEAAEASAEAEVGEDLTPQAKAAATRKRKKAEAEAAGE